MQTLSPSLRIAEAQQLFDGLEDELLAPALGAFFSYQAKDTTDLLLSAVRQSIRDTMKEARLAGKVEAYETALEDLRRFAKEQLQVATQ